MIDGPGCTVGNEVYKINEPPHLRPVRIYADGTQPPVRIRGCTLLTRIFRQVFTICSILGATHFHPILPPLYNCLRVYPAMLSNSAKPNSLSHLLPPRVVRVNGRLEYTFLLALILTSNARSTRAGQS